MTRSKLLLLLAVGILSRGASAAPMGALQTLRAGLEAARTANPCAPAKRCAPEQSYVSAAVLEKGAAAAESRLAAKDLSGVRNILNELLELKPSDPKREAGPFVTAERRNALIREALSALGGAAQAQAAGVQAQAKLAPVSTAVESLQSQAAGLSAEGMNAAGARIMSEGSAAGIAAAAPVAGSRGTQTPETILSTAKPAKSTGTHEVPAPARGEEVAKAPFAARHPGLLRALVGPALHAMYDIHMVGAEKLPAGPVIFVANHTSFMDAPLLALGAKRPLRAWMTRKVSDRNWFTKWSSRELGAIPVHPDDGREELLRAMRGAQQVIKDGQSFIVFAEGDVTSNGNMHDFNRGIELLAKRAGVPVIPVHIDGLWGSIFSGKDGPSKLKTIAEGRRRVTVRFGAPLTEVTAQAAREAVQQLGSESFGERIDATKKTLSFAFLETAKKFWSRRAIADSTGKDLKYGEAVTGAVLLAGELKKEVSGVHVGVLLPPSVGGALTNVALSNLGKVSVNLNYTAGKAGMAAAIEKAEITSIVTSRAFVEGLQKRGIELPEANYVYVEELSQKIPKWKKAVTLAALRVLPAGLSEKLFLKKAQKSLNDTATVLFTSGSSGKPKGVELTHGNIQANIEMLKEVFPYSPHHTMLGFLPFFHSFGYTVTLWSSLMNGWTAAYHPNPLEVKAIGELAAKYDPTILLGTPTFLNHFTKRLSPEQFKSLKLVVAGAEKLRKEVADGFQEKFGVRPYEGYGATELSPVASSNLPDKPRQVGNQEGSIGHPLPGVSMKIVDPETFKPLPWGSQGLLLAKGRNVMKGYLNDPAKTAEVFKDGWYVTGDIAVMNKDGFATLVGRLSRFSKIAGEMVSHVAVEEALQKAAGLTDQAFVVVGVPDPDRGERLAVVYAGFEGSLSELRDKMQAAGIPNLWIPSEAAFHKVDAIPVLGTGKIDVQSCKKIVAPPDPEK